MNPTETQIDNPTIVPNAFAERRQKDLDLYSKWKETGSKKDMAELVRQLHPLIYSEVRRLGTQLPESALSAEAKSWAVHAIKTFDPNKGVALSTHVTNWLMKTRRMTYDYANFARMPENLRLEFTNYRNAISHLEEELNREPTDDEISKHLGWSKGMVVRIKDRTYAENLESGAKYDTETSRFNDNKFLLDHILDKLDDQEKTILLEKGSMSASDLAAKLGVNVSRLNYLSAKLKDKIIAMKREVGMY